MIWGGGRRKSRKKISEALLQEKIDFERHCPGKKEEILRGLVEEENFIWKGFSEKNKFISKISFAPFQYINGRSLSLCSALA